MDDNEPLTTALAWARALHLAGCLLLLAVPLFGRLIIAPLSDAARTALPRRWNRTAARLTLAASGLALVSGIGWLLFVAILMSGLPPREAVRTGVVRIVWTQTHFGRLWQLRAFFWVVASAMTFLWLKRLDQSMLFSTTESAPVRRGVSGEIALSAELSSPIPKLFSFFSIMSGAFLVGSLAWAGHGMAGPRLAWHLPADVVHLLICGIWPAGLLPFGLLLLRLRQAAAPQAKAAIAAIAFRFSTASLASVAILTLTGIANCTSLLGPVPNLWRTDYGRLLLLKIVTFFFMLLLGAANLLRWKPRLTLNSAEAVSTAHSHAAMRLWRNVALESLLALIILLLVGFLGLKTPANEEADHSHHLARSHAPTANP